MKHFKKELQEKMQIELPESLKTEHILAQLAAAEQPTACPTVQAKKPNVKKAVWLSFAACFVLVLSVLSVFMLQQNKVQTRPPVENDVNTADKYDAVFQVLHAAKENKNKNHPIYNGTATDLHGDIGLGKPENSEEEDKQHGTTNVQEKGVDESNTILTDGEYVYAVNTGNYTIGIAKATGGKMTLVSTIPIRDTEEDILSGLSMYLYQNRLVLVGIQYDTPAHDLESDEASSFTQEAAFVFVKVYDITDKTAPKLFTSYRQEGLAFNTRRIDNRLYLVSQKSVPLDSKKPEEDWIPKIYNNGMQKFVPAKDILLDKATLAPQYTIIAVIDLLSKEEPQVTAVLGECNFLYVSKQNLYTVNLVFDAIGAQREAKTSIHKYALTKNGVASKGCATVSGAAPFAFALSEQDGFLRVVTQQGDTTQVHVLDDTMRCVGSLKDLAKGEEIKSTRFMGNTLYLVTFLETDPLFVIDLSNPKEPTIQGEVKVPGFSQYLHPISDTLLLGIGPDGTDEELNGNMKLSLFDVSNPTAPKEIDKAYALRKGDTQHSAFSMVMYEHRLFVSLPNGEFAVPFEILGPQTSTYHYSRYKIENNQIQKLADYRLPEERSQIVGATFIGNEFYILSYSTGLTASLTSYSMTNHEPLTEVEF